MDKYLRDRPKFIKIGNYEGEETLIAKRATTLKVRKKGLRMVPTCGKFKFDYRNSSN